MRTLIKNIIYEKYDIEENNFNIKFIGVTNIEKLINELNHQLVLSEINDIKDFNEIQKLLVTLFINQYINLNPTIPKSSRYYDFLKPQFQVLKNHNITRGYYIANDVYFKGKIQNNHKKILNIGIMPTFLESYLTINGKDSTARKLYEQTNIDFISIKSIKNNINDNIYEKIFDKIKSKYPKINFIDKLNNFYNINLFEILSNKILADKYDLIIFDTYKNIIDVDKSLELLEEYPKLNTNNINRFISSLMHSKVLFFQVIFAINKLNIDGDLILLFPGFENKVNNQILIILNILFNNITLYHSDKDYSFRYFVICKGLKINTENNNLINFLTNNIYNKLLTDINQNNKILINLFDHINIINPVIEKIVYFHTKLIDKFFIINNKLKSLVKFVDNNDFIIKLYDDQYYIQLYNTYTFLGIFYNFNIINEIIIEQLDSYKLKLYKLLLKPYYYNFDFKIEHNLQFKIICENITYDEFKQLFKPLIYYDIFALIIFNDEYNLDEFMNMQNKCYIYTEKIHKITNSDFAHNEILQLVLKDIKNKLYLFIDYDLIIKSNEIKNLINKYLNKNKDYIIIKFQLKNIKPLLISLIYIFCNLYSKVEIIKPESSMSNFFIVFSFIYSDKITNIDKLLQYLENFNKTNNKTNNEINELFYLVQVDENFINLFSNIIFKFILKEIILANRLKFIFNGKTYTDSYYSIVQANKINKNIDIIKIDQF